MAFCHPGQLAALHAAEFEDHAPQRTQAPAQHQHLQQQQDDARAAQIDPQRAAEHADLRTQRLRVLQDVDAVGDLGVLVGRRPGVSHAVPVGLALAAVGAADRQRPLERFLQRTQQLRHRQLGTERGIGSPRRHALQHHLRIHAAVGHVETRIGRVVRRDERAVAAEFHLVGVVQRVTLQALAQVVFSGVDKGAVQRVTGQGEERQQCQTGRQQLARTQRTRPPPVEPVTADGGGSCGAGGGRGHQVQAMPARCISLRRCAGWRSGSRGRARSRSASVRRPGPASCAGGR